MLKRGPRGDFGAITACDRATDLSVWQAVYDIGTERAFRPETFRPAAVGMLRRVVAEGPDGPAFSAWCGGVLTLRGLPLGKNHYMPGRPREGFGRAEAARRAEVHLGYVEPGMVAVPPPTGGVVLPPGFPRRFSVRGLDKSACAALGLAGDCGPAVAAVFEWWARVFVDWLFVHRADVCHRCGSCVYTLEWEEPEFPGCRRRTVCRACLNRAYRDGLTSEKRDIIRGQWRASKQRTRANPGRQNEDLFYGEE